MTSVSKAGQQSAHGSTVRALRLRVGVLAMGLLANPACADSANIDLFPGAMDVAVSPAPSAEPPTSVASRPLGSAPPGPARPSAPPTIPAPSTPATLEPADTVPPLPLHRYSFSGIGLTVTDEFGQADGTLAGGATLDGNGGVTLDGNDDYVDLPGGLLSSLQNATLMAWLTWAGNNCWHRIFEFGSSVQGNGIVSQARTELFLTPRNCSAPEEPIGVTSHLRTVTGFQPFISEIEAPRVTPFQATLVVDASSAEYTLYVDGVSAGSFASSAALQDIDDEVVWLGRSLWVQDFNLPGSYTEFRMYDVALSAAQISTTAELGPDLLQ